MAKFKSHFKYYTVAGGTVTGIYLTFDETKENTDHVSGNIFKGFDLWSEAIDFMISHGHEKKKLKVVDEKCDAINIQDFDYQKYESEHPNNDLEDDSDTLLLKTGLDENHDIVGNHSCIECTLADDDYMIQCKYCQKWLHYKCTLLPAYTLSHYATTTTRYKCRMCQEVTEGIRIYFEQPQNVVNHTHRSTNVKNRDTQTDYMIQDSMQCNKSSREFNV